MIAAAASNTNSFDYTLLWSATQPGCRPSTGLMAARHAIEHWLETGRDLRGVVNICRRQSELLQRSGRNDAAQEQLESFIEDHTC